MLATSNEKPAACRWRSAAAKKAARNGLAMFETSRPMALLRPVRRCLALKLGV
ncbi:hypothetical protein D3C79_1041860 [compost metagenome]